MKRPWYLSLIPLLLIAPILHSHSGPASRSGLVASGVGKVGIFLRSVPPYAGPTPDEALDASDTALRVAQEAAEAEHARLVEEAAERAHAAVQRPMSQAAQPAASWPRFPSGCTAPGTFDPAPCIPRGTCVLPDYICAREAGSINVWNHGGSGASGKYQAMPLTWGGHGGYLYAAWAPESVQDDFALWLWNGGRGCGHWSAC